MQVMLFSHDNRNETVNTSFGPVTFDAKGYAAHEMSENDLFKARNLKWLLEESASAESLLVDLKAQYNQQAEVLDTLGRRIEGIVKAQMVKEQMVKEPEAALENKEELQASRNAQMQAIEAEAIAMGEKEAALAAAAEKAASKPVDTKSGKSHK